MASDPNQSRRVNLLVRNAIIVTMDGARRVFRDGALAVAGDKIVDVGQSAELLATYQAKDTIDGRRFVVTPGLVNCHIHITGEPLTRGYVPDTVAFAENVFGWLAPLHRSHTADERLSAQLAALEMLRSGTTSFIEAGSVDALDEVADGLIEIGIRGRIGLGSGTRREPVAQARTTDEAIRMLGRARALSPRTGARIAAWPTLVGHSICTDELWQAAEALSVEHGDGPDLPHEPDGDGRRVVLEKFGRRPVEHLADLGVLGRNVVPPIWCTSTTARSPCWRRPAAASRTARPRRSRSPTA